MIWFLTFNASPLRHDAIGKETLTFCRAKQLTDVMQLTECLLLKQCESVQLLSEKLQSESSLAHFFAVLLKLVPLSGDIL